MCCLPKSHHPADAADKEADNVDNEDIVTLIALERQDLSRMYLAHHELESIVIIIITITAIMIIIIVIIIDVITVLKGLTAAVLSGSQHLHHPCHQPPCHQLLLH